MVEEVGRRDLLDLVFKKSQPNLHTCKFSPVTRKLIISLSRPPCARLPNRSSGEINSPNTKKEKKKETVMSCSILIRYDTLSLLYYDLDRRGGGEAVRDLLDPHTASGSDQSSLFLVEILFEPVKRKEKEKEKKNLLRDVYFIRSGSVLYLFLF